MNRKQLLLYISITVAIGALVIALNPDYRDAFMALLHGRPSESNIWKSNSQFYIAIQPRDNNPL